MVVFKMTLIIIGKPIHRYFKMTQNMVVFYFNMTQKRDEIKLMTIFGNQIFYNKITVPTMKFI